MSPESKKVIFTLGLDFASTELVNSAFGNNNLIQVDKVEPSNLLNKAEKPDLLIVDPMTKDGLEQSTLELMRDFRKVDQITPIMILSPFVTVGLILRAVRMEINNVKTSLNFSPEELKNSAIGLMS